MSGETVRQAREDLDDWYRELTLSLMAHHGRLGIGFETTAEESQFGRWLAGYVAAGGVDAGVMESLQRLHGELHRHLARLLERQHNFMKSRLAFVGIERCYRQLSDLLLSLEEVTKADAPGMGGVGPH